MNCDVAFFADVQTEGCWIKASDDSFGCHQTDADECAATLSLTITEGAYFDTQPTASDAEQEREKEFQGNAAQMFVPVAGQATIHAVVEVNWPPVVKSFSHASVCFL
jgi:hypothetical protein